jgi:glycosyltransferase involved in cell wall biosynthesis
MKPSAPGGNAAVAPAVSVVVFCRNAVTTIEQAIRSVTSQSLDAVELIVLDGGSTDGTLEILRRHEQHIDFLRSAPDGGPTPAINEGWRRARGDVIVLLPGDDWLEPGALELVAREFGADPDLEVLSCGTRIVRVSEDARVRVEEEFADASVLEFRLANVLRHPLTAGRFVRRRVYERFGGHSGDYVFGDYDFLVRVCLAKVKSKVRSELAYTYRRHAGSSTLSGRPEMTMIMMRDNLRLTRAHLATPGLSAAERRALLTLNAGSACRLAVMQLARGRVREALTTAAEATRLNWLWPLFASAWFAGSLASKIRYSR